MVVICRILCHIFRLNRINDEFPKVCQEQVRFRIDVLFPKLQFHFRYHPREVIRRPIPIRGSSLRQREAGLGRSECPDERFVETSARSHLDRKSENFAEIGGLKKGHEVENFAIYPPLLVTDIIGKPG